MRNVTKTQLAIWAGGNIIAALLLFWATEKHGYDYYILLRWVTFAVCVGGLFGAYSVERKIEAWLYGIIGLLFNPIIPIHLRRHIWEPIDIIVGIGFLISAIDKLRFIKSAPSLPPEA